MTRRRPPPAVEPADLLELGAIYAAADALVERQPEIGCRCCTRCCRFGLSGREPYLTALELAAVQRALRARGGALVVEARAAKLEGRGADEGICPLLTVAGECAVYVWRPFGCRTHHCAEAGGRGSGTHRQLLSLVRRLREASARHGHDGDRGRPLRKALGE